MTAQIAERLHYEGEEHALCGCPLEHYFAMGGHRPDFQRTSTGLWRRYVGEWEVLGGRLYLIGLEGELEDGTAVSVATLFPGFSDRVFAHWCTGTLRIPQGQVIEYAHMGFDSTYERDLLIEVERGVVTSARVEVNGVADEDDQDKSEGYFVGGMLVFGGVSDREGQAS